MAEFVGVGDWEDTGEVVVATRWEVGVGGLDLGDPAPEVLLSELLGG